MVKKLMTPEWLEHAAMAVAMLEAHIEHALECDNPHHPVRFDSDLVENAILKDAFSYLEATCREFRAAL